MVGKNIVVAVVVALLVVGVFVCLPTNASAWMTGWEHKLVPGMDYTFSGGTDDTPMSGYFWVNASDIVTFNWKSGDTKAGGWYASFNSMGMVSNYSEEVSYCMTAYPPYSAFRLCLTPHTSPLSTWIQASAGEYMRLFILSDSTTTKQTINFTITPDPNSLEAKYEQLKMNYSELNQSYNQLNQSYSQLNQSYNKNTTILYSYIALLESEAMNDRAGTQKQISDLQKTIQTLRDSAASNDTILLEQLDILDAKAQEINASLTQKVASIPSFNDTLIWDEINNLSEREPTILVNNTTIVQQTLYNQTLLNQTLVNQTVVNQTLVNQTPISYVNKTDTISGPDPTAQAVLAGVVAGVGTGTVVAVLGRRKQDELTPIQPAEE